MKFLIKIGNEYCFKINRGNYYVADEKNRDCCYLNQDKAKRYAKRLAEMGINYELITTMQ